MLDQIFKNGTALAAPELAVHLLIGIVLCLELSYVYQKFGRRSVGTTELYGTNLLLVVSLILIISVIKSSIALSLGLVGALSVIRFRTVIKEPEQLSFMLLIIGVGISLGAGFPYHAIVAAIVGSIVIFFLGIRSGAQILGDGEVSIFIKSVDLTKTVADFDSVFKSRNVNYKVLRIDKTDMNFEMIARVDGKSRGALPSLIEDFASMKVEVSVVGQ